MTFEEWFKQEPMPESYHNMAKAFYLLNKELSRMAWEYQQAIIDEMKKSNSLMIKAYNRLADDIRHGELIDMEWIEGALSDAKHEYIINVFKEKIRELKDQLESERQRADEYFDKWDNLRVESEFEKL